MELPVQGMEALSLHMGIDLGGADVGMAQQKLHGPQVSPAFQQVGGKGMAEGVRRDGAPYNI